ncbi:MAG: alpha-mannosidase [Candidatus Eremiobacteraeota bacterium]|nr:alpha-mannosidase [Candidatus Eremiobacteraeota bacterium]
MRVRLERRATDESSATLVARTVLPDGPLRLRYPTRTGALLRIDGSVRGAFDGKHRAIDLPPLPGEHELALEVERRSLPVAGLPAGDGLRWRWMLARAGQRPHDVLEVAVRNGRPGSLQPGVPLVGHAHLDVAWLWTYGATQRKALRTFATALREVELDERYVFAQSQPQLYAWVLASDRELFERIKAQIWRGWDAGVATMWVEPDLHAPSGESLLRQFAHGIRWMREHAGVEPNVAWLPDSFGFPSTFPTLARHAGVPYFAATKLAWNETTRWPYARFCWLGDDGSTLVSAMLASYDGDLSAGRLATARTRDELLVVGYGDGGGGATDEQLARVAPEPPGWTRVDAWLDAVAREPLPEYRGELYLETHRGTYTTHHDVKAGNAALERALTTAEELAAWCVAVRAPLAVRRSLADDLRAAWGIVLRGQFHDVISGSAIGAVYTEVDAELARAAATVARVVDAARAILPRSDVRAVSPAACAPERDGETWRFRNAYVEARARDDGTLVELSIPGAPNVVALANGIVAYRDRPRRYDAWNLDAGYDSRPVPVRAQSAEVEGDALVVRLDVGRKSRLTMRLALHADEPWLRVEIAAAWRERHVLLRAEHRVALPAREVRYGQPHGTIVRTAYPATPAERARFEVPAQRWAHVEHDGIGLAVFSPDLYGWSAAGLDGAAMRLGTSLLRSPCWPDAQADRGEHALSYAFAPTAGASISALERGWEAYALEERVRLFTCDDPAVLVTATAPSDDGTAVVVRVRECDGETRGVALRCGARMRFATAVDAVERPVEGDGEIVGEELRFTLPAFGLRAFLVAF